MLHREMSSDRRLQTTHAADGRTLAFAEWGDLEGRPHISLHGTPGCRLNRHPNDDLIRSTGVHLVTYDRAGYGGSDRKRGRNVADCVADVIAIADTLGFDRFAVSGGSGGGPHALAVAALVPDRVTRAACIVGVAPYEALGDSWTDGMDPENVKEFSWAMEGEERLAVELARLDEADRKQAAEDASKLLEEFDLPESDREIMARPEIKAMLRESALEQTRNGIWGWVDDNLAFVKPWGFDVAAIHVPTAVWYGAQDVLTPPRHGEWLARHVPGARVRVQQRGHLDDPDRRLLDLNAWLLEGRDWG